MVIDESYFGSIILFSYFWQKIAFQHNSWFAKIRKFLVLIPGYQIVVGGGNQSYLGLVKSPVSDRFVTYHVMASRIFEMSMVYWLYVSLTLKGYGWEDTFFYE